MSRKNAHLRRLCCIGSDKTAKISGKIHDVIMSCTLDAPVDIIYTTPASVTQLKEISVDDAITAIRMASAEKSPIDFDHAHTCP